MLFHVFFVFFKIVIAVVALSDYSMIYSFLTFYKSAYVAPITQVNFRGKITNNWHIELKTWLSMGAKFKLSFLSRFFLSVS